MTAPTTGRPRERRIDVAVLRAAGDALDERGLGGVVMADLARRSGVSKAAIYRRWPDRTHVVLDTLRGRMEAVAAPGTGCTLCDLDEVLRLATRTYATFGAGTMAQLLAETATDDALRAELLAVVVDPVRDVVHRVLVEARARDDLRPDVDLGLCVDTLTALVFHRLLLGAPPLSPDETTAVITNLLRGVAARPDALLAEYAQHVPEPHP